MVSSLFLGTLNPCIKASQAPTISTNRFSTQKHRFKLAAVSKKKPEHDVANSYSQPIVQIMLQKSLVPLAASIAVILWSSPANAGFLSGFSGIESIPGPQLPEIDFLTRFNEENQKKYAEADARFKESPLLKKLLEKSKSNKEKNWQEIMDKYCIRGAEWGVGDCSAAAMTAEEREKFISMLKQKAGVE